MPMEPRHTAWRRDLEVELPWMQELACHLVRDREAARELVQDAWLKALERPPRERGRPRAWLGTVMRNLVRQGGRRAARRGRTTEDARELSSERFVPPRELERAELEALVRRELARLAEPYRSTLRDHYERGLSSAEIARRRRVPAGTVRWRLKTGLDRLRERLDERYGGRERWTCGLVALTLRERRDGVHSGPGGAGRDARPELLPWAWLLALAGGAALLLELAPESPRDREAEARVAALSPARVPARESARRSAAEASGHPATLGVPGPAPAEPPARALPLPALVVEVQVTDEQGEPVAGAELCVGTAAGFEPRGTSDALGRARLWLARSEFGALEIPAAREHVALRARAAGHASSETLFVPLGHPGAEPLVLALGGAERVLRGRITDEDGRPLRAVDVFALRDPYHTSVADTALPFREPLAHGTSTDANGAFELGGLAWRELVLCIRRPGAEPLLHPLDAERAELDFRLPRGGTIRGRILDPHGEPARDARVWVEPLHRGTEWCAGVPGFRPELRGFCLETRTGTDGSYELRGVHPRARRILASSTVDPSSVAGGVVLVSSGACESWSAFLGHEPGLCLRLLDREERALEGWVVELFSARSAGPGWVRSQVADAQGRVSFFEVGDEADMVVFDPSGQGQPWLTRRVCPSFEVQEVRVDEGRLGLLAGRLADEFGAVPANVRLEAHEESARLLTSIRIDPLTGRFRVRLQPGSYTLLVRGEHGGGRVGQAEVASGQRTRLGRVAPPAMGGLRLFADAAASQESYRLLLCSNGTGVMWREGALPLALEEPAYSGLYRLDAPGPDGILQSGWARVVEGAVTELDLEALPRVEVEVLGARDAASRVQLTIAEDHPGSAARSAEDEPLRRLVLKRRSDGRMLHALRLSLGVWRLAAESDSGARVEAWLELDSDAPRRVTLDLRLR
jgi:RNA polymerase sigma-70 factor (ECF subfamily)